MDNQTLNFGDDKNINVYEFCEFTEKLTTNINFKDDKFINQIIYLKQQANNFYFIHYSFILYFVYI